MYLRDSRNEFELSEWFIGPFISLIDYENDEMSLFAFHELTAQVGDYELTGKPDVMFARGIDEVQTLYFFFHCTNVRPTLMVIRKLNF
jgi:hypothetical protein